MYGLFRGSSYKPSTVGPKNVIPNPTPTQPTHQRTGRLTWPLEPITYVAPSAFWLQLLSDGEHNPTTCVPTHLLEESSTFHVNIFLTVSESSLPYPTPHTMVECLSWSLYSSGNEWFRDGKSPSELISLVNLRLLFCPHSPLSSLQDPTRVLATLLLKICF